MTPAARVASAIQILDEILAGEPAEKQLTTWARQNRYAGSKDRAAVRDLVFEVLRSKQSLAISGGAETGRGMLLGLLRMRGDDPDDTFTGEGYAPAPLTDQEKGAGRAPTEAESLDAPEWLIPQLQESLGADFESVFNLLKSRAPVFLRVNLQAGTREQAIESLASEEIVAEPHELAETALIVTKNPRRVQNSQTFASGLVELQDAASQFVAEQIPVAKGNSILDYCAGGGGKSLALAARMPKDELTIFAHDISQNRMRDIPTRAERAGVNINLLETSEIADAAPFEVVVCDVPCSGSGAWRRAPEGKWTLTTERLTELTRIQREVLEKTKGYVSENGVLAYLTCSLLRQENQDQIDAFLAANSDWKCTMSKSLTPLDGGDGFFVSLLTRS
ncbi:RsmB/NOP family class I SAM-dependent RNA methyltransferase [Falsihalocynthiibacter sp. SS001]|uniref:RsmB/NOP family class I SAM-dependent RNA methyltransferase n=1 Tax=Falsihalocynthiibacter sp. SS001 TaxID=3349698 RepID=UPI0036D336A1